MRSNRRTLLKTFGLGAAGFMLSPWNSNHLRATPQNTDSERYFIFCFFTGGWDTLLSLDTRDPGRFPESQIGKSKIHLGFDRLPERFSFASKIISKEPIQPKGSNILFGPAMTDFAEKHYDVSCVVRGLSMDTVDHNTGTRYINTGQMPTGQNAKGSSIATRIVAIQKKQTHIPNLVVRVATYNSGLDADATGLRVGNVGDLLSTLADGPDSPKATDELRKLLENYRKDRTNCDPMKINNQGAFEKIKRLQSHARALVSGNIKAHFDFMGSTKELNDIKNRYQIQTMDTPEAQAATAFQAVKHNISQCVSIELAKGLDTHDSIWNTVQIERQRRGFLALTQLVSDLKTEKPSRLNGKSLLDVTTIVCVSEFGRTSIINNRDGRDHSIASSALLIGAGIPHNKVVGATTNVGMDPEAIDPITGEPGGNTKITPSSMYASIMKSAAFDTTDLRESAIPALMPNPS